MKTRIVKKGRGYLVQKKILLLFWTCAVWDYDQLDANKHYFKTMKEAQKAESIVNQNPNKTIGTVIPKI